MYRHPGTCSLHPFNQALKSTPLISHVFCPTVCLARGWSLRLPHRFFSTVLESFQTTPFRLEDFEPRAERLGRGE